MQYKAIKSRIFCENSWFCVIDDLKKVIVNVSSFIKINSGSVHNIYSNKGKMVIDSTSRLVIF